MLTYKYIFTCIIGFFCRKSFLSTLCKCNYLRKETKVFTDISKNVFFCFIVKVDNSKDNIRSDCG